MPARGSEKCRQCSKLSVEQALQKHGSQGTGCWEGEPCHKRRTYYRNRDRYNQQRRRKYRAAQDNNESAVEVPSVPQVPAAILHLYRPRVGDPLHAVGAELWVGQKKVAAIEPVHTLGMSGSQVKTYLKQILQSFSQEQGVELEKFAAQVELDPAACPIYPCPLRP